MRSKGTKELIQHHCNRCLGERKHTLLFKHKTEDSEKSHPDEPSSPVMWWEDHYELLECCGCGFVSMKHMHIFSEIYDQDGKLLPEISVYPPRVSRQLPRFLSGGSSLRFHYGKLTVIRDFIQEIYNNLHSNNLRSAAMGIRALLEFVMIDRVGDQGSFQKNIKAFKNEGYIASKQINAVNAALDMGSAVMHRSHKPDYDSLCSALDIVEGIIESTYLSESRAESLKKKTPPRPKRHKTPKKADHE